MSSIRHSLQRIYDNERWFLLAVYALALLGRISFILYNYSGYQPDGAGHERIAWNILAGKGFSLTAYWTIPSGGPTAAMPPVYPYFLALVFALFPVGKHLVVQLIQAGVSSLVCLSGYFIAKGIFGRGVAALSALLMALSIFLIRASLVINRTAFFILFLSLVVLASLKLAQRTRLKDWVAYGLLVGATALISPEVLGFIPLALAWILYHNPGEWRARIQRLALMLAALLLVISPWLVRNYMVFQRLVPIVSSFGINFWEGNNPNASGSSFLYPDGQWRLDEGLRQKMAPYTDEGERIQIMRQAALEFIRQNPGRFIGLRLKGLFYFWFSHYNWERLKGYPPNIITLVATLVMNILAVIGMTLGYRKSKRALLLILLFISFSFIYTITHGCITYRYRLPLDPYLLMFVVVALKAIYGWLFPPVHTPVHFS